MLEYNIKGTNLSVTDEVRTHIEKSLSKAEKLLGGESPVHVDAEIEALAGERDNSFRAEFNVAVGGKVYRAEARGQYANEAIDVATNELLSELRTAKKKRLAVVRRHAVQLKEFLKGLRN